MDKFLIYHHLGLGDHIICNGLVREICNNSKNSFLLPAKKQNFQTVEFMFRDLKNLTVVSINGDECIASLSHERNCKVLTIGHQFLNYNKKFDQSFYDQLSINFNKRWSSFFVMRDYEREAELYDRSNTKDNFIFVHDDHDRGMSVDAKYLQDKNIIKSDRKKTNIIFDYLSILENAKEIHCIESSFLFLVDSFNFKGKLFNHRYARQYPENNTPTLRNEWNILNKKTNENFYSRS
jgi:hypothetical protein